jgi:gas vesicle protein
MFCSKDDRTSCILMSVLVGGVIGAGIALLLAPQSGRETREKIADLAEDMKDSVTDFTKKVTGKLT